MGRPVPKELRDQLIQVVTRVLAHLNADVDAVVQRAQMIARRIADGENGNIAHYATKALFAIAHDAMKRQQAVIESRNKVLVSSTGKAVIEHGLTRFSILLDLSKVSPGSRAAIFVVTFHSVDSDGRPNCGIHGSREIRSSFYDRSTVTDQVKCDSGHFLMLGKLFSLLASRCACTVELEPGVAGVESLQQIVRRT